MAKKEELDNIAGNEKLRALQAAMEKIEKKKSLISKNLNLDLS